MKNQAISKNSRVNITTKISVRDTLLAIGVGHSVIFPQKEIRVGSIRVAAFRLEQEKKAKFHITEKGLVNETRVMRLG